MDAENKHPSADTVNRENLCNDSLLNLHPNGEIRVSAEPGKHTGEHAHVIVIIDRLLHRRLLFGDNWRQRPCRTAMIGHVKRFLPGPMRAAAATFCWIGDSDLEPLNRRLDSQLKYPIPVHF